MSKINKLEQCIEDMRFKDLLINAMSKEKSLLNFIDDNLILKEENEKIVKKNIDSLKKLNENDVLIVKARAKQLEESLDPSKYFPTILGIFGFIIILYRILLAQFSNDLTFIMVSVVISAIVIFLISSIGRIQKKRAKAVYFNSLITNIYK